jgi:hypothetical protein
MAYGKEGEKKKNQQEQPVKVIQIQTPPLKIIFWRFRPSSETPHLIQKMVALRRSETTEFRRRGEILTTKLKMENQPSNCKYASA